MHTYDCQGVISARAVALQHLKFHQKMMRTQAEADKLKKDKEK